MSQKLDIQGNNCDLCMWADAIQVKLLLKNSKRYVF
jgi:hypothetical protein